MGRFWRDAAESGPGGAERMVAEARRAFFAMCGFLAVIWLIQVANWADGYRLSQQYGLIARDVATLPDVLTAPLLHWSWAHIEGNSGPLFVFGFLAAYRGVRRFLGLTLLVAVVSGLTVWFLQGSDADTVGASGLIFGYFGYVVLRGIFDRRLIDTLIGVAMALSFAYLLLVVVPGTPGVSWLGHLGGLAGGVAGAWVFRDRGGRPPSGRASGPGDVGTGRSAVPPSGPRADLHKELGDLGLLQGAAEDPGRIGKRRSRRSPARRPEGFVPGLSAALWPTPPAAARGGASPA